MRLLAPLFVACFLTGCFRYALRPHDLPPGREPPAGMVEVNVASLDERYVWDVYTGDTKLCSAPCAPVVKAQTDLLLESRYGELYLPELGDEVVDARHALLVIEGPSRAKKVNGIVFTTLGGMGLVTAIALSAVGCSDIDRRGGLCTGGLITGAASLPLTAFALWMLIDSGPHAHLVPVFKSSAANGQPAVTVVPTPGGIAGTF